MSSPVKNKEQEYPSIFRTFIIAFKAAFFNEQALVVLILNKRHTLNLVSIFLLMFALPIRDISGNLNYSFQNFIEAILLTLFFITFLYLFSPNKKIPFSAFFRIFMAFEVIDIFALLTLIIPKNFLIYFYAVHISWYLSLAVFTYSKINRKNYIFSTILVFLTFLIVNLIPAVL